MHGILINLLYILAFTMDKSQFVKIKSNDFKIKSAEINRQTDDLTVFVSLLQRLLVRAKPIRLLGIGLRFHSAESEVKQSSLF